jgi:hypothetical protein
MPRYRLDVNGRVHEVAAEPGDSLLSILREDLGLTGSKYGCGEGQCGACTVLVDGQPTRSCVTRVGTLDGRAIVTIEGIAMGGTSRKRGTRDRRDLPSAGPGETPIVCVAPAIGSAARTFGTVATALPVRLERV